VGFLMVCRRGGVLVVSLDVNLRGGVFKEFVNIKMNIVIILVFIEGE
jgi:hypothetical protein